MPTNSRVCPWELFVDMAKQGLTGNWHLFNVNGSSVSDGAIVMQGINTNFPLFTLLAISASITLFPSCKIMSRVPFHSPLPGPALRFHNNMTGAPTFNVIA